MDTLLIVIVLALLATAFALMLGLVAMASGGPAGKAVTTSLMWARVGLQGFTCLLLIAAVILQSG